MPSPAQSADPGLSVLDSAAWSQIAAKGRYNALQLGLLTLRNQPSLLDEKKLMQFFIMANNCVGPNFIKASRGLTNELEYPGMVSFYKSKAPQILTSVPRTLVMGYQYVGAPVAGHPDAFSAVYLGEYDLARKAFPFVDHIGGRLTVALDEASPGESDSMCSGSTGFTYDVSFPAVKFTDLPMSEADARTYLSSPRVGQAGLGRQVVIFVEIEVLPDAPQLTAKPNNPSQRLVSLKGRVSKVTIANPYSNNSVLGVLYP
jgi:hypothetical protein